MAANNQSKNMVNTAPNTMEPCGNGLWRLSKNGPGSPPPGKKWIHISGPYYREAPTKPTLLDLLRAAAAANSQESPPFSRFPSTRE
jgi:hypothetical protein